MKSLKILALFSFLLLHSAVYAQVNHTISFQGILTDTSRISKPDGIYLLTFRLYDTEEGGAPLWSEQNSIQLENGLFSHQIGSINSLTPSLTFDRPYWLTLEVSGESELAPRIPLGATAYSFHSLKSLKSDTSLVALRSDTAYVAINTLSDTLWKMSGNNIYRLIGNVGIGKIPSTKLDVEGMIRTKNFQMTEGSANGRVLTSSLSGFASWNSDLVVVNQNVGIGTNSPDQKLDVNGYIKAQRIQLTTGSANGRFLFSTVDGLASWSSRVMQLGSDIVFTGDVGINDSTPKAKLHVAAGFSGWDPIGTRTAIFESNGMVSLALRGTAIADQSIYFEKPEGTSGGRISFNDSTFIFYRTMGRQNGMSFNARFYMDMANGWLGIRRRPTSNALEVSGNASKSAAGDWLANSDRRIKREITEIENASDILLKLRPVKFKYTDAWKKIHPEIKDHFYYNFIAQEYKEVFPNSVQGSGEFLDGDPEEILQIDTYNAQIITIKAAQELIKENELLRKELAQLRSELNEIKSAISEGRTMNVREIKQ